MWYTDRIVQGTAKNIQKELAKTISRNLQEFILVKWLNQEYNKENNKVEVWKQKAFMAVPDLYKVPS